MSNPQFSSDPESLFPKRIIPAPITHLPTPVRNDNPDPAREIRLLIEQLQASAQEARTQARSLQGERDDLAAQLENSLLQIDRLRTNERDSRAQFVEVASVMRARDAAVLEADRWQQAHADFQRQLESAIRERNDAQRQRDDLNRRHAEDAKTRQHALAQLTEAQKQTICLRQARDSANAKNLDLSAKVTRHEDQLAELTYQREAAAQAKKQMQEELAAIRRQLGAALADRDATAVQVQDFSNQLDEARHKILDLAARPSAEGEIDTQQAAALAEARQQVLDVSVERDAARGRSQELLAELAALRSQIAELHEQLAGALLPSEAIEDLQRQLATLAAERDALAAGEHRLAEETTTQQAHLAQLTEQFAAAQQEREEALLALANGQRQFEEDLRGIDAKRHEEGARSTEMQAQIAAQRVQISELEGNLAVVNRRLVEVSGAQQEARQLATRFEKQRLATIDLGTRLELAQREIVELSAHLAEARLAERFANSRAAKEAAAAMKAQLQPVVETHRFATEESLTNAEVSIERSQPLAPEITDVLHEKEARSALAAMRQCFQAFQKNSTDLSLLNELYSHAYGFSERARVSGYVALHRLCAPFSRLAHEVYEFPETLNQSTMRTIGTTIEFLIMLMKDRNVAQVKDPAKASVYIVDDDADNCDAIKMAMETAMLRATTVQEPGAALAELSAGYYDLIFLDVNLPGMDGFELCSHIRDLPGYAKTPIIFLTGMTTLENRVQSSLSGGNDFVGKPFNLHELTVKALTLILKAELLMD